MYQLMYLHILPFASDDLEHDVSFVYKLLHEIVWHFFATSRGKSTCNGIGSTVEKLPAQASL